MLRTEAEESLKRNNRLYTALVEIVQSYYKRGDYEKTLEWITLAAMFAWEHHPGKFTDGAIENIALEIGRKMKDLPESEYSTLLPAISTPDTNRKKVLHVASTVYNVGGHTRLIRNWIKSFPEFQHSFLLTNQASEAIPDFLPQAVNESGGSVFELPKTDLLTKAKMLRRASQSGFDYVLLHHHANDLTPTVAFAVENCLPVAVINHADHIFWLGASVADLVVDFCARGARISRERRFAAETTVVPYLADLRAPQISRAEARRLLGIGENETILITIGSPHKYFPNERHNFFSTAKKILERNPNARLFLVGPSEHQAPPPDLHSRMMFLGLIDDATPYQIAADIYLDGFPLGGGLASLETTLFGAYPVFAYNQLPMSSSRRLLEFEEAVENLRSEAEYIDLVGEMIQNDELRREKTARLVARIQFLHGEEKLRQYARETFGRLDEMRHAPAAKPCPETLFTDEDIWLPAVNYDSAQPDVPLLLYTAWKVMPRLDFSDYLKLFFASVRKKDTKFSYKHLKVWGGTFGSKMR